MSQPSPFAPLEKFYRRANLTLPAVELIEGAAMSEPCKSLLVHERDMTSTLERFHGARCHVHALQEMQDGAYSRLVVLELDGSDRPIEFGAIDIHLDVFSESARRQILLHGKPLGAILNDEKVDYVSCPQAFFRITPDALIRDSLRLGETQLLFGRCNRIATAGGQALAEIVEILPPLTL